ncbi:MAG: tannase/feruloyl esterase family alpha/beta hydrolase [Pseudomonadota bacterium]
MNTIYKSALPYLLLMGGLSACGGGKNDNTEPVTPPPAQAVTSSCVQLAGMQIAATSIGLPTSGAVVTGTKVVPASGTGTGALGEYCIVSGSIKPVDASAPNIQFQVALPKNWNANAVMFGGGGFNGVIPDITSSGTPTAAGPLARGYAVFASDSGHQEASLPHPTAFMLNQEANRNFMGDALKKTRDTALVIVKAAYGAAPKKSYFIGGSNGGREALLVGAVWPADWDGIAALYPARPITTQLLGMLRTSRALAAPGAYPNRAKRGVLYQAALAACDGLDGVKDGLISDEKKCEAVFNPATAVLNGVPLRCAGGADTGDNCLSDAQLGALETMNNPVPFNFSLASGATSFPGFNVYTSDLGGPGSSQLQATIAAATLGNTAPGFPYTPDMPNLSWIADGLARYGVAQDASFNYLTLDPLKPGPYASQLSALSTVDNRDTNMGGFAAKGGKLLIMHGTADMIITSRGSESYVQGLQSTLGLSVVDSFLRFYLAPGFGHGIGNFTVSWDFLSALENWVEKGVDPKANQVITDVAGIPGRTRPLCIYPTWAKYNGSGDVNSAASFTCALK